MSDKPKLIVVAQIAGAFGVKGEARVRSFTDDPAAAFTYGPLLDADGRVVLTPVKHRPLNEGFGVTTAEKKQREEWEAMRGTLLHAAREALPAPAEEEGEVYVADLIGCDVVHVDGRRLGVVKAMHDFGAGDLVEVQPPAGQAYFLPFTEDVFTQLDMKARVVRVDPDAALLPEGMMGKREEG
ncbi:MAG: 16S rRNA processing protein RimM [Alphaproteobacteria bacterium 32-64-14]|nr:MAG: 16S rRNA processing protein RimM [Alphaproteobacteria bacterium 32-64-14]